jgi:uncharacterized protein DUF6318
MSRRFAALCVTVACCFALTACGSGDGDKPSGSASTSTSSSPSAGAQVTIPDAAKADTPQGASTFASYWVDTLNAATDSGKTAELKALSASTCTRCADFAQSLDRIYSKGGSVKTDGWQVLSIVPVADTPKENPGFQLNVQVAPQTVVKAKGAKPKKYEGGKQGFQMFLVRSGDHWVVDRINI